MQLPLPGYSRSTTTPPSFRPQTRTEAPTGSSYPAHSVDIARQYPACVGKVANGQVAVTLHGVWGNDDLPLTGRLYLPE